MRNGAIVTGGILLLAYAGWKAFTVQKSIDLFTYNIMGVKFNLKNLLQPKVTFKINVYNPNQQAIPIRRVAGVVKAGSTIISTFANTEPLMIDGNLSRDIAVECRISAMNVFMAIYNKQSFAELKIDGMINTGLFDLPLSHSVKIPFA